MERGYVIVDILGVKINHGPSKAERLGISGEQSIPTLKLPVLSVWGQLNF